MSLSNIDLLRISKNYKIKINAICFKNELLNYQLKNGYYIINLANEQDDNNGTHWCGIVVNIPNCIYFDSFGAPPPQEVINFLKPIKGVKLAFSNQIIQNIKSENCGYFVIAFFVFMKNTKSKDLFVKANEFFKIFRNNTIYNDQLLLKYLKNNISR
jgi:hypothetical protein